jgi:hypothetical protein
MVRKLPSGAVWRGSVNKKVRATPAQGLRPGAGRKRLLIGGLPRKMMTKIGFSVNRLATS